MADPIGYTTLQVIPTMANIGRNLGAGFAPFVNAGRQAGQDAGRAAATGVEAARSAVEKASSTLAKARDKEADAAGRIRVAEEKLAELRQRGITSGSQYAAASERLATAQRNALRTTEQATTAATGLAAAEARAATATDDVASSAGRAGSGFGSFFSNIGGGTKQLLGFTTAAAGVGGALASVNTAMDNQADFSQLAAAQGADPTLAKEYGATAGRLYAAGVGSSMGEVTSAIDAAQSSFATLGFEGEASLDQVATRAVNFGKVFGTDVDEAIQTASQLVTNGLAADSTQAFDLMTTSFQNVPKAMRGELPEILQEYGTNFRALGIEGPDAFNMLVSAAGQGKFALDKTGDALKEFTIRGSDMSKSSVAAYEAIGLNATEMSNAIASGGPAAQAALKQTAEGLLSIENPSDRANAAIALFGTPLEDLSVDQIPDFLSGLTGAQNVMAGFEGSTDQMGETLNDNAKSKLETFKRGIQSTFVDMLGAEALPMIGDFTSSLQDNEGSLLATVAGMTGLGGAVAGFESAKGVFDSVSEGVTSVKDGFVSAKDGIKSAWDTASKAGDWAGQKARAVGSFVATSASATVEAAKTAGTWVAAQARAAAAWTVNAAKATASFVVTSASAVTQAAITSGAWIGSQIAAGAGWLAMQARAVGSFVAMGAAAVAQALVSSGAWVVSTATTVGALAVQGGAFLAQKAIMVGGAVATGVMTAAQWALNVALNANPIGLVIIALTALVAGVVLAYKNSETFRNIVQAAFEGVSAAASFMYDNVLKPVFDGVVATFKGVGDFLGATGSAIGGVFDSVGNAIGSAFSGALDVARPALRAIGGLLQKIPDKIFGFSIPGMGTVRSFATTLQSLRTGGTIAGRTSDGTFFGPGTGTSDSLLGLDGTGMPIVRVSAGEGVVKERAMLGGGAPVVAALNAGWVPSPQFLAAMLPGLAGGGLITADALNAFPRENGLEGAEYDWGGVNWGDCSGAMSALANTAAGWDPFGSRFATGNMASALEQRGALPGLGPAGSMNFGWYNGGPYGGHTAGTLPDGTNVEMGGARGDGQVGGGAAGADDSMFTEHAHFPPEFFLGGDPEISDAGSSGPDMSGSVSGGSGGPSSSASSSSTSPTPGGSGGSADYSSSMSTDTVPTPGGSGVDDQYAPPTGEDVAQIGTDFLKANSDQFLSDLGLPSQPGGLLKALIDGIKVVEEHVHYHVADMNEAMREERDRRRTDALAYNTVRR